MPPYCVVYEAKTTVESESPRERNSHQIKVNYIVESSKQITHESVCSVS